MNWKGIQKLYPEEDQMEQGMRKRQAENSITQQNHHTLWAELQPSDRKKIKSLTSWENNPNQTFIIHHHESQKDDNKTEEPVTTRDKN